MRDYAKISPQFWIGSTGRKLRDAGPEATLVALYLLSNPHANMLGLYYLPQLYIAHETGLGIEGASKGLRRAIEAEFCDYDEASEVVFVCEMARFQIAERLEPKDKRCIGIQREYDALPNNLFLPNFYEKYVGAFHLKNRREGTSPLEEAPKALRSQEQEQEQEQEREQERAGGAVAPSTAKTKRACQMSEGFQPKESHRALAVELGVNLDDLLVSQPSSGEEALRICETLVRSNALDVIVLDSVAALVTRAELEGEIGDATVGAQARLMSAALRKLT